MSFEVRIDCLALFNECMETTLLDYRNRTTESGRSMAATHTLEESFYDSFTMQVRSVAEAVRASMMKHVELLLFLPDLLLYRLREMADMTQQGAALRIKDALKYGMLAWWYAGKDAPLFQYYQTLSETALEELRYRTLGTHTQRPSWLLW